MHEKCKRGLVTEESSILFQLKNVTWQAGAVQILNSICFDLRTGEFKLITGQSGYGKSTLPKIVAPLISPSSGEILFEGKEISTLKPEAYRQQVSHCAQVPALFGDTVYDNLIFPWQIRDKRPDPDVSLADLARFELPETILKKNIDELSDGEKQRVLLIRNLQFLSKILLLDEITSALDEPDKRSVNELIHHYVRDKNTAASQVTYNKDEIDYADNVITLQPHAGEMQEVNNERA